MKTQITQVPVISQNIYTSVLTDLNNLQIISDIDNYGVGINKDSPQNGWVSNGFIQYEDIIVPITPEIRKLEEAILGVLLDITNTEYKIHDMWAVNLEKNQSVIAHSHHSNLHAYPGEYYSIAYYPDAPKGSAELIFLAEWCGVMQKTCAIAPEDGMLIVFNSYMTHMTARHKIDKRRLVVSMNLGPVNPNMDPNADWSGYWDRPFVSHPVIV
jgi:hypothetical protein